MYAALAITVALASSTQLTISPWTGKAPATTTATAAKYKLTTRTIEVDRSGRDPNGKPIDNLPSGANVIGAAFSTDVDVDSDAVALPAGGFVWYNVASITPSHERALDEVKDEVEAHWRNDQIAQRLAAKASEFVDKLKGGAAFPDVVNEAGLKVEALWGLKRGAGSPPLGRFFGSGVGVAIGTDSLSSTPDLNLFNELSAARTLAPRVPASRLLESATVVGARALGFAEEFGTIQPGRSGRLLAMRIPEGVADVEEYLVSGVQPGHVQWLD